jgi:hypothetical protein
MVYTGANECLGVFGSWLVSTSSSVGRLRFSPACYKSRSSVNFIKAVLGGWRCPRAGLSRGLVGGKTRAKKKKRRKKLREEFASALPGCLASSKNERKLPQRKTERQSFISRTLRQSSLKINFPSMGLPPTKIEAVILNSNVSKSERKR